MTIVETYKKSSFSREYSSFKDWKYFNRPLWVTEKNVMPVAIQFLNLQTNWLNLKSGSQTHHLLILSLSCNLYSTQSSRLQVGILSMGFAHPGMIILVAQIIQWPNFELSRSSLLLYMWHNHRFQPNSGFLPLPNEPGNTVISSHSENCFVEIFTGRTWNKMRSLGRMLIFTDSVLRVRLMKGLECHLCISDFILAKRES